MYTKSQPESTAKEEQIDCEWEGGREAVSLCEVVSLRLNAVGVRKDSSVERTSGLPTKEKP